MLTRVDKGVVYFDKHEFYLSLGINMHEYRGHLITLPQMAEVIARTSTNKMHELMEELVAMNNEALLNDFTKKIVENRLKEAFNG